MEIKQFTSQQFDNAFEGSAADLLKQVATAPAATPSTTTTTPPADADDPLKPRPTLDPDKDAATLLQQQQTPPDEDEEDEKEPKEGDPKPDEGKGKQKGRPPVEKIDDGTRAIVNDLIKEGKLFGFTDGKIETKKDLQELLDANFQHRIESQKEQVLQNIYQSFSPAMQTVLQYASQIQSPAELLPLLQTSSSAERFSSLDETNPTHQEMIIRERMRLNGDPDDVIEQEISDLKDRAKLADRAKVYKPVVQQYYENQAKQILQAKAQEEQEFVQQVQQNDLAIRKVLDAPELDGLKLKQQHKGVVYELLAVPRPEYGGGLGIYTVIDQLLAERNFAKLAKIALLAADDKAFEDVYGTKVKFAHVDNTIRTLNTGGKTTTPIVTPDDELEPTPQHTLTRPSRTGFGFGR